MQKASSNKLCDNNDHENIDGEINENIKINKAIIEK